MKYRIGFAVFFFLVYIFYQTTLINAHILSRLDFKPFYTAGSIVKMGKAQQLFSLPLQQKVQQSFFPAEKNLALLPFINPPFVALLFWPFSFFPILFSYLLFNLVSAIFFIISLWLLLKKSPILKKTWRFVTIIIVSFLFEFVPFAIFQGQLSFILFLSVTACWYFLLAKKPVRAGLFLGLLCSKPHLLLLPVLLFLIKKQWGVLTGLLISIVGALVLSWILVGTTGLLDYVSLLVWLAHVPEALGLNLSSQPTLMGMATHIFGQLQSPVLIYSLSFLGCFGILLWVWRGHISAHAGFSTKWSAFIILLLLSSWHSHEFDSVLILFPLLVLLQKIKGSFQFYFVSFLGVLVSYFPWERVIILPMGSILLLVLLLYFDSKYRVFPSE